SPEQIMGLPVDGRSDLFSAGVILYQFLTGERPFSGSATTTMQKVLKEEPLPPTTLNVQLPSTMDAVVRKALAKRADERFQTAQEFADALLAAAAVPAATASAAAATSVGNSDPTIIANPVARAANAATPPRDAVQPPATAAVPAKAAHGLGLPIAVVAVALAV